MWEQLTAFIQDQLNNNQLFQGGALLMVGGAVLALVRGWPMRIWGFIKRQSMVVIDVPDKDDAFSWINIWLAEHKYSKHYSRLLTVSSKRQGRKSDKPKILLSPAPGTHWLWHKRRFIILTRDRKENANGDSVRTPHREIFTIRILGRNRTVALSFIDDCYQVANPGVDNISIYKPRSYGEWYKTTTIPRRTTTSVILATGDMLRLIDDLNQFLQDETWYHERGIPYRRGYLFYGPPGNGKTSVITALASKFDMDVGILNLKSDLDDDDLTDALANIPPSTILLLEDIDCIASGRETEGGVSFSGLLNALDGLSAAHGQIVFMTTNHLDKLDPALIRPGRCDVQKEFTNAQPDQLVKMFSRFFPNSKLAEPFSKQVTGEVSMATLQGYLMKYRRDPQAAFDNANTIKE